MSMKMYFSVLMDEETRAQIREVLLNEAKSIARSVLDKTITEELKRLLQSGVANALVRINIDATLKATMKDLILGNWNSLKNDFTVAAEKAVEAQVEKKMAALTVWKASTQKEYVQKLARLEAVRVFKKMQKDQLTEERLQAEIMKEDDNG